MASRFLRKMGLVVTIIALLVGTTLVFADNVQNDVTAGGNGTITAGGTTTVNYRIAANNGDGQTGCNAADTSPATVTINVPAGVTASPASLTFTSCNTNLPVIFSSNTAGSYEITVSVSDSGAGTYNTNPAKFTLQVNAPTDTTPPVVTYSISGTLGNNGWYTSDVMVTWNVVDNESALIPPNPCYPTTINADTNEAGVTITCSASSAGGTANGFVTIKRDATAPTISGSRSPAANANGWNNEDVAVTFTCADPFPGSGMASCGPDQTLNSEGAAQSVEGTAVDMAGNSASDTVSGINIDKTAPIVSLVDGPADGASYYFGAVPAAPTCSASDALSGVDGACGVSGYGNTVGSHTVVATATDLAGNSASESATYSVLAWTLKGFYQPVDMNGVYNGIKGGSTVPLKFEVFAGPTELTSTTVVKSFVQTKVECDGTSPVDELEFTTTGGTTLRYDATGGQFIQNWQTLKLPGICYRVSMTTQDGSSLVAFFRLK